MKEIDNLDIGLLCACQDRPGKPKSELVESFSERSPRALYYRLESLEQAGLVRVDRNAVRGRSLCYITESGKEAIAGRKNIPPKSEESS